MEPTRLLLLYYARHVLAFRQRQKRWRQRPSHRLHLCRWVIFNLSPVRIVQLTDAPYSRNAREFGYKLACRPEQYIRVESGVVLIWGGPNRMLPHCVSKAFPESAPMFLPEELHDVRLNFTFRDAPKCAR